MPSWNIHTAHVEELLASCNPDELGIADANAFLFGNYVPDVYLGFMVPDITYRLDYCLTHIAQVNQIPVPDSDRFWDMYIFRRRPINYSELSLALGAWAHLLTDRCYNSRFRDFRETHDTPQGEKLRMCKQADFDLFGHALGISTHVQPTRKLFDAAKRFHAYSILPDDARRAIDVADNIVANNAPLPDTQTYQLLDKQWMNDTFDCCASELRLWLATWQKLESSGQRTSAEDIRAILDFASET